MTVFFFFFIFVFWGSKPEWADIIIHQVVVAWEGKLKARLKELFGASWISEMNILLISRWNRLLRWTSNKKKKIIKKGYENINVDFRNILFMFLQLSESKMWVNFLMQKLSEKVESLFRLLHSKSDWE